MAKKVPKLCIERERHDGCLLGHAIGDAFGAPYEGGILEQVVWQFICGFSSRAMRWTDDTQMSLATAESLISLGRIDPDDLARRFSLAYEWSRGYGPGTAKVLKKIARGVDWRIAARETYPGGSYGNGGAMRASIIGLYFLDDERGLSDAVNQAIVVTHSHPLAIEGACMIASATAAAARGDSLQEIFASVANVAVSEPFKHKIRIAKEWLASAEPVSPAQARKHLGNGLAATDSCVTAIYSALAFLDQPFKAMHEFVKKCGGDVDTIGAMSGAIWGAYNGSFALPNDFLIKLEKCDLILETSRRLYDSKFKK
jgi:poly(ADP-ribose) glycohydrolase ARH3